MFNSKQQASWNLARGAGGQSNQTFNGRPHSLTSGELTNGGAASKRRHQEDLEGYLEQPSGQQRHHQRQSQQQQQQQRAQLRSKSSAMPASASANTIAAGSQASFITSTTTTTTSSEDDESLRRLHKRAHSKPATNAGSSIARRCCRAKPGGLLDRLCVLLWRLTCIAAILFIVNALVYFWPIASQLDVQPKVAPLKPRPKFEGPLEVNNKLDQFAEKLYEGQFHAPESMAWTANKRAFFTGVEGGFILLVEPYAERWTIAARLNARLSVEDQSRRVEFAAGAVEEEEEEARTKQQQRKKTSKQLVDLFVPFCTRDVELYGSRAEFEPSLVRLSRCSRPLGIRLAPNETHLYVADPLSGLYRVDLVPNLAEALASQTRPLAQMNHVSKLLDFAGGASSGEAENALKTRADSSQQQPSDQDAVMQAARPTRPEQVHFGDDIAVEWAAEAGGVAAGPDTPTSQQQQQDVIYITDCSRRWSLRYLFWLMLENDDSGRVLRFETRTARLSQLDAVLPVRSRARPNGPLVMDERGLSFPNGLELTANKSALMISDLNNRRILMHHLRGPLKGVTNLLMWTPGYSDNVRRGLDLPDGTPTYWFACGCAVSDGKFELAELANDAPFLKRLLLRWLHVFGATASGLGRLLGPTSLKDAGLMLDAAWLKVDPYCRHGVVAQFTEQGQILRSLHGPGFSSNFKLLSEAHQVPLLPPAAPAAAAAGDAKLVEPEALTRNATNAGRSLLYLGSVYYSYLGRLELEPHLAPAPADEL